ncbi:uncharacterized protein LOC129618686 [Condylostylus longicornis]|uniref:uncharacterized protein LOC129618686 n=1 Tax=Condylostylus longicornis TaxID=2530218 RepID=UPI00244DC6D5|nr:uncharacterized protein LOC129618686 [Condylostylus longicornis]
MNFEINFGRNLTRNQILQKYLYNLNQLKLLAETNFKINNNEFNNFIIQYYFTPNRMSHVALIKTELVKTIVDRKRKIFFWLFYLAIGFLCVSYKNEASTLILRNIQTFIYPGMKLWRRMTLPMINNFPGLTELYDESCLMMNPFFQVEDLDCNPCSNIVNVLDLTNVEKTTDSVPFVFKVKQIPVTVNDFFELYKSNKEIFQRDAYRVRSTNNEITNLDELFRDFNRTHQTQSHNLWRCNRMSPARLIRQLFVRPERLPSTGIALERFLSMDTHNAESYILPDGECSNMYIQQIQGTRNIILRPTIECRNKCRSISIRLTQSYVLSYNWWYWKPVSAPDSFSKTSSISLIGSYC